MCKELFLHIKINIQNIKLFLYIKITWQKVMYDYNGIKHVNMIDFLLDEASNKNYAKHLIFVTIWCKIEKV